MTEAGTSGLPRITLVTPVYNCVATLEQTIRSVLIQDYPNLEYIIVDGGSTDGTVDIIRRYEDQIHDWISEPDKGMFDALNKGYARSSGEIMGWIASSDMLHIGSLKTVASVLERFPHVEWITGCPTNFEEDGRLVSVSESLAWTQLRFLMIQWHFIQQESTFWRRSLWERAGSRTDDSTFVGGDLELWIRFFRHANLHRVHTVLGGYRYHEDSLGTGTAVRETELYKELVIERELASLGIRGRIAAGVRELNKRVMADQSKDLSPLGRLGHRIVRRTWKHAVRPAIERWPSRGVEPTIHYRYGKRGWILKP